VIFGTGMRGRSSLAGVSATIGGVVNAPVFYAGPTPGVTGLDQVNLRLPSYLSGAGQVDIVLTVDLLVSNKVSIQIGGTRPVERARQIVGQMTLDEKIQSLHGIQDPNNYRTVPGIPRTGHSCAEHHQRPGRRNQRRTGPSRSGDGLARSHLARCYLGHGPRAVVRHGHR